MSMLDLKPFSFQKNVQSGLSEKEARKKLLKYGPNVMIQKKNISVFKMLIGQFNDFMTLILLASTCISIFMGEAVEAVTIICIVVMNAILGFIQEYRAERTMEALKKLAAPLANVIRDGKTVSIPAEEVVPGDLVLLEAGDRVPADAVLIEANEMKVDESLLTGESIPVDKKVSPEEQKKDKDSSKINEIYMGTVVTTGRGRAIVTKTGMNTEMGKIADMIQNIEETETPLQKRLDHLGKYIVYGCLTVCAIVSLTGVLRGEELYTMLMAGISLAVAAVPEGLPATVTIALALGVQRMVKRKALVRKLPAVETLGCATVICSDKTGTLTENKMTVRKIFSGRNIYELKGSGTSTEGDFVLNGKTTDPGRDDVLMMALRIGGICNNAKMDRTEGEQDESLIFPKQSFRRQPKWEITGDPTEAALLVAAAKGGLIGEKLYGDFKRTGEIPFDSERKCMSVICEGYRGGTYLFTKGAPDVIIQKCSRILTPRGEAVLSPQEAGRILRVNDTMAREALRVLAVAYRKLPGKTEPKSELERDLVFCGLVGMIDPPRHEVREAVRKCRTAGIKPVMITGDHKITAAAIAKELNILEEGDIIMTGSELDEINDRELSEKIDRISVYARVSPKHKLRIVRLLKKSGHVAAMTGDGVNDAPAVKEADIGVAMGIMGTDVTKEASSMILMNDNFSTIVAAIEEGRTIYGNIRKFIRYLLACNIGEVLTMFLGMLLGLPIPLLPIHILWINLVTDGLPAIALGFEPAEKDIMMQPPRDTKESIFARGLTELILFRGIFLGLSTLAVFTTTLYFTGDVARARTAAFATLVLTQLIHVFECKSEKRNIFEIPFLNNIALILAVCCSLSMLLAVIYIPALRGIFKTVSLLSSDWTIILGFSFLGPVLASLFISKRRSGRKK
ncbi:MAG TPA: calcium-translocating P-type ATPase, SERCA-type [Clostridiaceae bacterium]|nr:calcium-translocating P-type ATPase, SERCA-type [Clostridiaceae bacterium]